MTSPNPPTVAERPWPKKIWAWAKPTLRVIILALVTWGVWRVARGASDEFQRLDFSLTDVRFEWLAAAGVLYILGLAPNAVFWRRTLQAMGQHPRWDETLRAFYVGHLGKYVPGKALVVVLRTGLIHSHRVSSTVAAVSVFVETLTMMAVGATIAAIILALRMRDNKWLFGLAVGLAIVAGLPTWPPIFRKIVRLLKVKRANPQIESALSGLNLRLMASGWVMMAVGWSLVGLSLWATLKAIPIPNAGANLSLLETLPLLTACVALAMVAGFASLLPGGIGVRELVVIPLLAPLFEEPTAVIAAVLLRLTWVAAELVASAILSLAFRRRKALETNDERQVESPPESELLERENAAACS